MYSPAPPFGRYWQSSRQYGTEQPSVAVLLLASQERAVRAPGLQSSLALIQITVQVCLVQPPGRAREHSGICRRDGRPLKDPC